MKEKTRLSSTDHSAEEKRMCFNGFSFPVLSTLIYQADGPDKENPDRLFIEDRSGRFLIYFEADDPGKKLLCESSERYETVEYAGENKALSLSYPLQKKNADICVGFFCITFSDHRVLCGDLSIRPPVSFTDGLKEYRELHQLFWEIIEPEESEEQE